MNIVIQFRTTLLPVLVLSEAVSEIRIWKKCHAELVSASQ
jgi:hypothetical protein